MHSNVVWCYVTNSTYIQNISVVLCSWIHHTISFLTEVILISIGCQRPIKKGTQWDCNNLYFTIWIWFWDRVSFNDFVAIGRNLYSTSSCHETIFLLTFIPVCLGLWSDGSVQFVYALTKLLAHYPSDFQAKAVRQAWLFSSESLQFGISIQFPFPEKEAWIQNI